MASISTKYSGFAKPATITPVITGGLLSFFKKLFAQIRQKRTSQNRILMILSEECDLKEIKRLANEYVMELELVFGEHAIGEQNCIFAIKNI